MSIRFAAPKHAIRNRMEAVEAQAASLLAANDNAVNRALAPIGSSTLHAALRHFAQHGLAAARHARTQAEAARQAGDDLAYAWWLEICRALDRRMAFDLDRQAI
jgi:hypothetical protein